jgi:hypothetical protein
MYRGDTRATPAKYRRDRRSPAQFRPAAPATGVFPPRAASNFQLPQQAQKHHIATAPVQNDARSRIFDCKRLSQPNKFFTTYKDIFI